ncbi:unnamed protein product, partial [marine sediment metagenome]
MNSFKKIFLTIVTLSIIASLSIAFTGCPTPVTEKPTATEEPTVTEEAEETPTEEAVTTEEPTEEVAEFGTAENPLVMAFAPSGEADRILASGEKVEKMIEERDLINSPWMQRLTRIHQLQSTWWVYPGGEHSRFQHSLGVMYMASEFARQLYPSLSKVCKKYGEDIPSEEFV